MATYEAPVKLVDLVDWTLKQIRLTLIRGEGRRDVCVSEIFLFFNLLWSIQAFSLGSILVVSLKTI